MGVGQYSLGGSGAGDLHAQPPVGASLVNAQGNLSLDMSIWRCDRIGGSARAGGAPGTLHVEVVGSEVGIPSCPLRIRV